MGGFFSQPKRTASVTKTTTMEEPEMDTMAAPGMDADEVPTTMAATTMAPTTMAPTIMASPSFTINRAGYIITAQPVYATPAGVLPNSDTTNQMQINANNIPKYLKDKNLNFTYNYAVVWKDGGFQLFNITDPSHVKNNVSRTSFDISSPGNPVLIGEDMLIINDNDKVVHKSPARVLNGANPAEMAKDIPRYVNSINFTGTYNCAVIYGDGGVWLIQMADMSSLKTGVPINQLFSYNSSTSMFGNISRFGAGGSGMLILLLLLLVAAVLYYLYTQGKIKIPSFEQRMASFGKATKSLRRRR
jgi:hypothetical protein